MPVANPTTVNVDCTAGGVWEVELPDRPEHVSCETLDDAKRVAYLCAAHRHPCELIVRDAYHRVLHRVLIDGDAELAEWRPDGRQRGSVTRRHGLSARRQSRPR
jgi:hypothetical protein